MSLTIGSSGKNLNELIASMLAQMNGTASTATPAATTPVPTSTTPASSASSTTAKVVVGSGKASYSNEIMGLFSRMHQNVSASSSGSSTPSSSATTTTIASATTLASPIDSSLSSIDTATAAAADPGASDSDAPDTAVWSAHMRAVRPDA